MWPRPPAIRIRKMPAAGLAGLIFSRCKVSDTRLAGPIIEVAAGENLSGHKAVAVVAGEAVHADKGTPIHRGLVRGVTTGAANDGDVARVQVYGPMREPSWAWTPGLPIYVGTAGALTQSVPTSGWLQQIAVADTATQIFIDPQPVFVL